MKQLCCVGNATLARWRGLYGTKTSRANGSSELDNTQMPWQMFGAAFSEEALRATYTYLGTLPPSEG